MTKTEYDQKRRECREAFFKDNPAYNHPYCNRIYEIAFDRAYALGKKAAELSSNSEQLNAAGEDEMLCVSRKEIQQLVEANDVVILEAAGIDNIETIQAKTVNTILSRLFGSKCLPDELPEDYFAKSEPKLKVGDKAKFRGQKVIVTDLEEGGYVLIHTPDGSAYGITESDLEPYTEPGKEAQNPETSPETAGLWHAPMSGSGDATAVLNDFGGDRRLNIAAMAMQGILSSEKATQYAINNFRCSDGTLNRYSGVAECSLAYADALIKRCEKGGGK